VSDIQFRDFTLDMTVLEPKIGSRQGAISRGHRKTEQEHRFELCTAGRWLSERGFTPATDGNLSVRLGHDRILTTPSGVSKGSLSPEDLVITDLNGRSLDGCLEPSSELGMHLLIYRRRPDANAVCHAHPMVATGYAAAGLGLDKPLLAEMVVALGKVPLAAYAQPGTPWVAASLEPFVAAHEAILLANHGVVTFGEDLLSAFHRMEVVEHCARVTLVTELLGKQNLLSGPDLEKLASARGKH
jgi:L-fuculose-phosphate aldolase